MYKVKDLSGREFSFLKVIRRGDNKPGKPARWICKCKCGKEKTIEGRHLLNGSIKSCGSCFQQKDLIGQTFGRLKVLKYVGLKQYIGVKRTMWECLCSCGNKIITSAQSLNNGTLSCGCARLDHKNDIVGLRFGNLLVNKWVGVDSKDNSLYSCTCDCGNVVVVHQYKLKISHTKSCGCLKHRSGSENPNWNPNLSDEWRAIQRSRRYLPENRIFVESVLKRDNFKCQACFIENEKLHVHHKDAWSINVQRHFDLQNGITLCKRCHRKLHSLFGLKTNEQQTNTFIEESRRQALF